MSSKSTRALIGFAAIGGEVPFANPDEIKIVGLDIPESADNWFAHCPRLKGETNELLGDYVSDIVRTGKVDAPVKAYRDGHHIVLLDGRRSTRSARLARAIQAKKGVPVDQRVTVRVQIFTGSAEELFRVNTDSHKQKPLTPTQHAASVLNYYNNVGQDVQKTAIMFTVTDTTVRNVLKLFDLHVDLQKKVDSGDLPVAQAYKLAALPRVEQKDAYQLMEASGATKGAKATNSINAAKNGQKDKVGADDSTRTRSRQFLEKLEDALRKRPVAARPALDPADLLKFVMGGPVPRGCGDDFKEILTEAGFKAKGKGDKAEARS